MASLQNAEAGRLHTSSASPKSWAARALSGAAQDARCRHVRACREITKKVGNLIVTTILYDCGHIVYDATSIIKRHKYAKQRELKKTVFKQKPGTPNGCHRLRITLTLIYA